MKSSSTENRLDVVIADDDKEDIQFFKDAIDELYDCITVTSVENGARLMQLLGKRVPDILFLDAHMPCMDGKECIKAIRADKRLESLPVIVFSGMNIPEFISFFYREGANKYIIKPASMGELKTALSEVFKTLGKSVPLPGKS